MQCYECEARCATVTARHFGRIMPFCDEACSHAYHVLRVGAPLGTDDPIPMEAQQPRTIAFDGTRLGTGVLEGDEMLRDFVLPTEGININGGFCMLYWPGYAPVRVVAKRLSKKQVLAAIVADRLKPLFMGGPATTGSRYAQIIFRTPIVLQRKKETVQVTTDKMQWWLILRRVDAPVLRDYVTAQYKLPQPPRHLWLPGVARDEAFMRAFARTFAYRMIVGITDPGPGNFLVQHQPQRGELPVIYSLDEASAFDPKLAPGPAKPWLDSNLAKAKGRTDAIDALKPLMSYIMELTSQNWRRDPATLREQVRAQLYELRGDLDAKLAQEWLEYVMQNCNTLERDWARLVSLDATIVPPAPTAEPPAASMEVLSLVPPPLADPEPDHEEEELAQQDPAEEERIHLELVKELEKPAPKVLHLPGRPELFGTGDLKEVYHRLTFGREGQQYQRSQIKSLLQKAIRRNLPELAHFAAALLLGSFQVTNLVNRLLTIACEDISLGNFECLKRACQLEQLRAELYSTEKLPGREGVARWRQELRNHERFRQAVWVCVQLMCVSPKTRICDHAGMVLLNTGPKDQPEPVSTHGFLQALGQTERGNLERERALFLYAARHISPGDHKQSVKNMLQMVKLIQTHLATIPALARVAHYCHFSLEARNATHPQKIAGKNNFASALFLCTRPIAQIRLTLENVDLTGVTTQVVPLYTRLIAGQQLPAVPLWALDKHTGRGPERPNESFLLAEQEALRPRHEAPDDYYARAVELGKLKDEKEYQEREAKKAEQSRKRRLAAEDRKQKKAKE